MNNRICAICGKPLNFPSSDTMNDVCSESCNDIYVQIPPNHIYWDYPEVEFIAGIHRDFYKIETTFKPKRKKQTSL